MEHDLPSCKLCVCQNGSLKILVEGLARARIIEHHAMDGFTSVIYEDVPLKQITDTVKWKVHGERSNLFIHKN